MKDAPEFWAVQPHCGVDKPCASTSLIFSREAGFRTVGGRFPAKSSTLSTIAPNACFACARQSPIEISARRLGLSLRLLTRIDCAWNVLDGVRHPISER